MPYHVAAVAARLNQPSAHVLGMGRGFLLIVVLFLLILGGMIWYSERKRAKNLRAGLRPDGSPRTPRKPGDSPYPILDRRTR